MEKNTIVKKLKEIVFNFSNITKEDTNINLFCVDLHISPVNMVYLLLELEEEFHITIDDNFIDALPSITIDHLADAIYSCSHSMHQ